MDLDSPNPQDEQASTAGAGRISGRWAAILIALLGIAALSTFAYPLYVIWPFRAQGATQLAVALAMKQAAFWVTSLLTGACLVCLFAFWNRWRWAGRSVALLFTLIACASIWLARFNLYEKMFHPMGMPAVEPADTAKIDPDDMVIAVKVNGNARAYPIREMGYHHIANDWVGGEPIVATY